MTVATLTCVMVTLCVLFYVFYLPGRLHLGPEKTRLAYLQERKEVVYENLRDLNFEHQAGKIPDQDYQSLKASLEEEAAGSPGGDGHGWNRPLPRPLPGRKGARV